LPLQTPPTAIGNTAQPADIPKLNTGVKLARKVIKSNVDPEPILSETSTGAESDSSTVVFDQPITKKSGVLAFVPSQVGGLDSHDDRDDTPPSSYDETDWTLNSDAVRNIVTTSAGIRVLPAAYKTAKERRIGLVTKLLREFPEYAQLVLQVGRSPSTKKGVEPRPIHVFVDMSNVCVALMFECIDF
jgi:hypothetical protein